MKTLGILGGMGPQASLRFCEHLLRISREKYGAAANADYPHFLLSNLPVPDLIADRRDEERTVSMVEHEIGRLESAGAEVLVLPCNTMHLFADRFRKRATVPFLSMIDAVCGRVDGDGVRKIALVGSASTMRSGLYRDPLARLGIQVLLPPAALHIRIVSCITHVIAGNLLREDIAFFERLVARFRDEGAEGVILGCTELPLIAERATFDLSVYDSLSLLAEQACRWCF
jgi:aspartate racemase